MFALPGQQLRWGQQMPERELELALEAPRQKNKSYGFYPGNKATLSLV